MYRFFKSLFIRKPLILDLDILKSGYPEVYEAARNEVVSKERERIRELDEIRQNGIDGDSTRINELLDKAKFESGASALDLSIELLNIKAGGIAINSSKKERHIGFIH